MKLTKNVYLDTCLKIIISTYIFVFIYALYNENIANFFKVFSLSIILSISFLSIGGFLGFIFGFPIHKENGIKDKFERNSSLRQITDWLTKIIVGVTLVELKNIISVFSTLINKIGLLINTDKSITILVGSISIEFFIIGFILIYILTITSFFKDLVDNENQIMNILSGENLDPSEVKITDILNGDNETIDINKKAEVLKYITDNGYKTQNLYLVKRLAKFLIKCKEYPLSADVYGWAYEISPNEINLKINEAFIRSKHLKQFDKSNNILKDIIKNNPNFANAFYNLACNYNREYKDLTVGNSNEEYRMKLLKKANDNLKEAFIKDKGLYSEALKDNELEGLNINDIFIEAKC